jgi:hypothetical protein
MGRMLKTLKTLFQRKKNRRIHKRYECQVPAELHFVEDGFSLHGFVKELSVGGLKFKPNHAFILRRSEGMVRVKTANEAMDGVIRGTSVLGYGVEFLRSLHMTDVEHIIASAHEKLDA